MIFALMIVVGSLLYTHWLVSRLAQEERIKVELWAEALKQFDLNPNQDVALLLKILENNETIPVILAAENDSIIDYRNIRLPRKQTGFYLSRQLEQMRHEKDSIAIELVSGVNYIYYKDSHLLRQLSYYPYVQLGLIMLFVGMGYLAFSYSKRAEQNQVWVGMSKETAHQLGTPISSLMAWIELLKDKSIDVPLVQEMGKDVQRLRVITERFSKIGSAPLLKLSPVCAILDSAVDYMSSRSSNEVLFSLNFHGLENFLVPLNAELFGWVVENLCKNAVDAMNGKGKIDINVSQESHYLVIDFEDTGKGIPRKSYKTVFEPGYTTKKRGWGLGLSLTRRIIENYHGGKVFVRSSEMERGTVFRILLRKSLTAVESKS